MKILHTSDIHLREEGDERWETLKTLVNIGKKKNIDVFIISGDLFDKGIDAENLRPKIRSIFSDTGFTIVIIPGNHDIDSYKAGLYFGEDINIISDLNKPIEYDDAVIWGLPFEHIEGKAVLVKLHSVAKKLSSNKDNILIYHGELLDSFFSRRDFGEEGEGRYMPVKLSYFKNLNINYVLAGHFHSKFNMWELENAGYFVYPGSPISITKRETGQRKVNIFEVGKPPQEYDLDTSHFEEVIVEFDPFVEEKPLEIVKKHIAEVHPKAKVILTIKGFISKDKAKITEEELVKQIKEIAKEKSVEEHFEFKDIQIILEDDLFRTFMKKNKLSDFDEEKKKKLCDLAIKAMIKAKL